MNRLNSTARFFDRPDPPETEPRMESMRVVDRDRPRTVDAVGDPVASDDDPVTPE